MKIDYCNFLKNISEVENKYKKIKIVLQQKIHFI